MVAVTGGFASSQQRRMRPKREAGQGLQLLKEPLSHDADSVWLCSWRPEPFPRFHLGTDNHVEGGGCSIP
jgi:hypothetical protein